jgi:hypothetical protein
MGGCGTEEDSDDGQLPPIIDYLDDAPFIEFKHVTVEKAQQLVQGKWRVYRILNNLGFWNIPSDAVYEIAFVGSKTYRVTTNDGIHEYVIEKWNREKSGCELFFTENKNRAGRILENLTNDTLFISNNPDKYYLVENYWAVKIKDIKDINK